jgi:NADH:ubiquinone oxidoreductase subunit 4 (subunit M)
VTALALVFLPNTEYVLFRTVVMGSSIITCFWSQYHLIYMPFILGASKVNIFPWLFGEQVLSRRGIDPMQIHFSVGVDGISLFFLLLTTIIFPFCFLSIYKKVFDLKLYSCCLLVLESFLLFTFSVGDLFFFYVFFEAVLIPMFLIIGIWGSGYERIKAAYYFFFFTLVGSSFFLVAIFVIYSITGTTLFYVILNFDYID